MRRIGILVVLVLIMAASLVLTAPVASAAICDPGNTRPAPVGHPPAFFNCVPVGSH
jgi:hypothetical protein